MPAAFPMSCSLNLASCRLRAEALARQLHAGLWVRQGSSPGDSGCVSPCFGPPPAPGVVDRPPLSLRTSSLEDEEEEGDPEVVRAFEKLLPAALYGDCKGGESHAWRPDSPPESESFASESDSPALTGSTASNSAEALSELASPSFDYQDEGSPLADELRSRLRLIQSSQTSDASVSAATTDDAESSQSSPTLSSETTVSSRGFLSPPSPCPRLVRSTSLKTGKTPPGTPSRKKIVRFADVLGLDLEAVRHFVKDDDAPVVPRSAFADLRGSAPPPTAWGGAAPAGCLLVPQFEQPGSDPRFLDAVRRKKVCLENAVVSDLRVTGLVRVLNLGYEKRVRVRYTTTEWAAHTDLAADYVPASCDGFSDKFRFSLDLPHLCPGQRLVFALRYDANGQEFWDNNDSENYVLKVEKAKSPDASTTAVVNGPRWLHHFM